MADYRAPRSRGLSVPVTQSADKVVAPDVAQSLRLISAWANNSVSFASFSGRQQDQTVQHAADRRAAGRQILAQA
jgi:hypothetical protein